MDNLFADRGAPDDAGDDAGLVVREIAVVDVLGRAGNDLAVLDGAHAAVVAVDEGSEHAATVGRDRLDASDAVRSVGGPCAGDRQLLRVVAKVKTGGAFGLVAPERLVCAPGVAHAHGLPFDDDAPLGVEAVLTARRRVGGT